MLSKNVLSELKNDIKKRKKKLLHNTIWLVYNAD